MGLQNLQILTGSSIAVSGGTAQTFSPDNLEVAGGVHVVDATVTDFRVRPQITFTAKSPTKKTDGSYTKEIRRAKLVLSYIDSAGIVQYDFVQVETSLSAGSENLPELRKKGAQLLIDSDTDKFFTVGSKS